MGQMFVKALHCLVPQVLWLHLVTQQICFLTWVPVCLTQLSCRSYLICQLLHLTWFLRAGGDTAALCHRCRYCGRDNWKSKLLPSGLQRLQVVGFFCLKLCKEQVPEKETPPCCVLEGVEQTPDSFPFTSFGAWHLPVEKSVI